jgi:RNA polymerase sigma-70 factor, ECF subfamily
MVPEAENSPARGYPGRYGTTPTSPHDTFSENTSTTAPHLTDFSREALPHMDDLYRTAASMLRSRTEAEDAVQEAYFQAWKSFHRFTPGTNCRAWLFRILFHVIAHQRRKWYSRFIPTDRAELERTTVYSAPVAEELSDKEILDAVRKIPPQYAEVLMLADVHEFSYKEIQETLGIPIGTVMSRLSRGRQLLRAQLPDRAPRIRISNCPAPAPGLQQ